jgi:hypothetical protein
MLTYQSYFPELKGARTSSIDPWDLGPATCALEVGDWICQDDENFCLLLGVGLLEWTKKCCPRGILSWL